MPTTPDTNADAAWGATAQGEPRWPATVAVVATLLLYISLPEKLTVGPTLIMPVLVALLLVPLSFAAPRRVHGEPRWQRLSSFGLIAIVNAGNVGSLILLVDKLLHGSKATGSQLVVESIKIWLTNVLVFALWYWELDRGGPDERSIPHHRAPDFLFPQMSTPACTTERWSPSFVDYLYVAFTNATAFSPTDTMPLTPLAKMLMLVQSLASLLTVGLVAARAVNILS